MPDELVPPVEMLIDGSHTAEAFKANGEGFVRHALIDYARLKPGDRVLDLGSGNGQKARALTRFLNTSGSYEGLDIDKAAVEWCQQHYTAYSNFRFQVADIYNDVYNSNGAQRDYEYRLPYKEDDFDVVFLCSVFTHMLPRGVANYIAEIGRVLKDDGRCYASFFLLNQESLAAIEADATKNVRFPHVVEDYRIMDPKFPAAAVALDELWLRNCFSKAGLTLAAVMRGWWSGRGYMNVGFQDCILTIKKAGG